MASFRVLSIILDGVGVGALPDAAFYGDEGSDTLGNLARAVGGLSLPHLAALGLGRLGDLLGVAPHPMPQGAYGRMAIASPAKDSATGHWELMGLITKRPFPTYPQGFPPEIIESFEEAIGRKILGNVPASGTEIIKELGEEHLRTGRPIVYTSADSVFQVAAHEAVIPREELYGICRKARGLLQGEHAVGRVIARPFIGEPGAFKRLTEGRQDFSLPPPGVTLLDRLEEVGVPVVGIGKIEDLFAGRGVKRSIHTGSNEEGVEACLKALEEEREGLILANLVDFDTLYGHRNDPVGFARALEAFDRRIPELVERLQDGDLLVITADHGNDPTTPSTDHSREYVPLLIYGPHVKPGVDLGTRSTLADLGQTLAEAFGVGTLEAGESFLGKLQH